MNYRNLGQSTLKTSELAFGCMSLPIADESKSIELIHQALEAGINLFDTADLYDKGKNEELVGKALKGYRDKIILATKVGNQWRPDGSGWDWNPTKEYILSSVDKSLKRLHTDHIDLYQLHGGTLDDPIDETIEAFEILMKQGKIRHYGISSIRPNVIREYVRRANILTVMTQYSLLDRRPEESILPLLELNNISVLARGTLAQGILVDKPAKEYLSLNASQVDAVKKTQQFIPGYQGKPAQSALQYVLHHPVVATAVVGIRNEDQLKSLLNPATQLTPEQYTFLQKANEPIKYEQHR